MTGTDWQQLPRYAFGDTPELADELVELVLSGKMTASCMDVRSIGVTAPEPVVGARAVVLDGAGRPRIVIETTEARHAPISSVTMEFVIAEGEEIATVAEWLDRHATFFDRNRGYSADMPVIFERFKVVRVLDHG